MFNPASVSDEKEKERTFGPDSTRSGAGILNETAGVSWIPLAVLQDPSEGFFSSWRVLTDDITRDILDQATIVSSTMPSLEFLRAINVF
ncbi:hypothetical protein VIGAN_01307700 [Vigna angularis var. angularis]|uniref:Uncharacterized protein n=1 Tax=Vigna angularis var. angularis TaxID=157739 RepID=A0A0S3R3N1_PHAAN|nr:hypothetical protein VIGAN_01307700 [Vigna angularis var. angularis]